MFDVRNLSVGYGPLGVLHDIGFHVAEGEVLGIIGPNGAGKTTLLSALTGLIPARSGSIRFQDLSIFNWPSHKVVRRGIGLVAQHRELFPGMSVQENLDLGARGLGKKPLEQRRQEIFALFPRLEERRQQLAGTLSGGERAMLATGRALMSSPRLLMLDEPTAGLSPLIVQHLVTALAELRDAGQTMVLVEQNVSMLLKLATKVIVLREGRIVQDRDVHAYHDKKELFSLFVE